MNADVAAKVRPALLKPTQREDASNTVLYLQRVHVSFDGFKALNNLSLYVSTNELRAVIGPNGAGKTTMMDVVTGKTKPDEGEAFFMEDADLTRMNEAQIANLGIGRKFQKPTVFENHTTFENLELALSGVRSPFRALIYSLTSKDHNRIDEVMEIIALTVHRDQLAGSLSHGQKQWLEIGMLLMQDPKLLLVDEPAAGMTDSETAATARLLKDIAKDHSVLVVEHDMEFVRSLDCRVTVLHEGTVLAEGSMDFVQNDERVIEVYLGR